jgi:hypothetical protein
MFVSSLKKSQSDPICRQQLVDGAGFGRVIHNAVGAQVTGTLGGFEVHLVVGVHLLMLHLSAFREKKRLAAPRWDFCLGMGVVSSPFGVPRP